MSSSKSVHPAAQLIAGLLGTWRGEGRGVYPTIDSFSYREEVTFWHDGRPWLGYTQRTWTDDGTTAMHSEAGYWRPVGDGRIEVVLAHTFGQTEILEGTISSGGQGLVIELRSTSLVPTSTAKEVGATARRIELRGDELHYDLQMELREHPLQDHLHATLARVS